MKMKSKALAILMSLAMVFTMMPMMGQTAHAETDTIELDGGSYTLTGDNLLVKDGTSGEEINIQSDQDITFKGNTEINLDGHELECASIKSGFENPSDPDIGKHPWYSYDLTIDGGDQGGSIQIGDPDMNDYALTANNLAIRNLSEESIVACKDSGNKVAIFAKTDLRIEGIKDKFGISGAVGTKSRDGGTNISDVSGWIDVNAMLRGIDVDDTNKNTIKISNSTVVIDVQGRDGNCINSGWKKGGISITDSIVEMSNSNNETPKPDTMGGYNALSASEIVNIKDSYVTAENAQKDMPAMLVYQDTGKLIISGESMVACKNVEGGSASALMANAIELKDGNRLFMPKDGYIGKTKYNGGSGEREFYTVLDKDGNTTERVGFGSGKEVISTVSAPSKVLPNRPIHMSGVLKDEDGEPVPNALLYIEYEKTFSKEVITNAQGIWEYKGNAFTLSDPGEASFEIHFFGTYVDGESPVKGLVRYLPPSENPVVKVEVISEGAVETLAGLELTDPPEGKSRKTEYKCGEVFDPNAYYVKALISKEYARGGVSPEKRDLDPDGTIITPAVLKYGTDKVNVSYMFEGEMASIEGLDVTVSHDWKEATCTEPKTCNGCGATEGEPLGLSRHANPLTVKGKTATVKYSKLKKKSRTLDVSKAIVVSNAQGAVSYEKVGVTYTKAKSVKMSKKALKKYQKKAAKKIIINRNTGKITVKKGLKKGTYKMNVNVSAAGNADFYPLTNTATVKIRVK
ncbi:MAG: cadherin repeat domain-containing protein [Firmicutes bacterium]|nr:cadherin repeat domain-containing protein [Bacillota bacterium]